MREATPGRESTDVRVRVRSSQTLVLRELYAGVRRKFRVPAAGFCIAFPLFLLRFSALTVVKRHISIGMPQATDSK
jgi:hypothetical protein